MLTVGLFLILYVGIFGISLPMYIHYSQWNGINIIQILLAFFLVLNYLISLWEIGLGVHIKKIEKDYKQLKEKYKSNQFSAVVDFFNAPLSLHELFSLSFWTKVWSTYSLYDPSYSNKESFGFFIDVGNGWTTGVLSIVALISMTFDLDYISARTIGILTLLKYYQELYGTVLYFLSFFMNERYKGKTISEVLLFVGLSNGLWFFFPLLGIYASLHLIYSDTYAIYRS